jgi:thiosulfate/3-mercaptopyruvate sulfurtransferase
MIARHYDTLIEPHELAAALSDSDLAVLDCRHDLVDPQWAHRAYREWHVPGAIRADVDGELSAPVTRLSGRHPLPTLAAFVETASIWGIDERVQVVAYDQGNGAFAARAWWLFRWAGHARVAVLNGGFAAWRAHGLPVSNAASFRERRRFVPGTALERTLTTAEVETSLASGDIRLIDARSADRFAGQNETIDAVAGHVPGAVNHPFASNLDAQGRFLPREELRRHWRATASGMAPQRLVAMCGSGVTACHNLLALELADMPGAALYAGSWSEWIRDRARPIARDSA